MKESKIEKEKRIVAQMVSVYCRHHEKGDVICEDCNNLITYAHARLEHCKFAANKPSCRSCSVHCYSPVMREKIRKVMRFAVPYMLLRHPIESIKHLF